MSKSAFHLQYGNTVKADMLHLKAMLLAVVRDGVVRKHGVFSVDTVRKTLRCSEHVAKAVHGGQVSSFGVGVLIRGALDAGCELNVDLSVGGGIGLDLKLVPVVVQPDKVEEAV